MLNFFADVSDCETISISGFSDEEVQRELSRQDTTVSLHILSIILFIYLFVCLFVCLLSKMHSNGIIFLNLKISIFIQGQKNLGRSNSGVVYGFVCREIHIRA
jgi:hypothetical protein